jgi:hypothetical protein
MHVKCATIKHKHSNISFCLNPSLQKFMQWNKYYIYSLIFYIATNDS